VPQNCSLRVLLDSARALARLPTSRLMPMTGQTTAFSVTGSISLRDPSQPKNCGSAEIAHNIFLSDIAGTISASRDASARLAIALDRRRPDCPVLVGHCFRERVATARGPGRRPIPAAAAARVGAELLSSMRARPPFRILHKAGTNTLIKRKPNGPRRSLHLIHFLGNKRFACPSECQRRGNNRRRIPSCS